MQPEEQTESHDKRIFRHSPYAFSCLASYIEPTGHYSPTLYYNICMSSFFISWLLLWLLLAAFALWPKTVATHQFSFRPQLSASRLLFTPRPRRAACNERPALALLLSLPSPLSLPLSPARSVGVRADVKPEQ